MQTSVIHHVYIIPRLGMAKKNDSIDKGTTCESPWNLAGARPPREEDFDEIHEKNQAEKRRKKE